VLLGCRRRDGMLSVEIYDTGPGIPGDELEAIFEEYHQLGNAARERSRGLGLGLSIVRGLGNLLNLQVRVRSQMGRGSVFVIDVMHVTNGIEKQHVYNSPSVVEPTVEDVLRTGAILVVEDDPEVRNLLNHLLREEGHRVIAATDATAALESVARGTIRPDLILTDFNLPNGMHGLQFIAKLREKLDRKIPAIVLTGDISTATFDRIAHYDCEKLNKPVKLKELTQVIQRLLARPHPEPNAYIPDSERASGDLAPSVIYVVDDDSNICMAIRDVIEQEGRSVETYPSCEAFIEAYRPGREACLLLDAYLPGMNGLELLRWLAESGNLLPAIMITGNSDVSMAVQAMKAGASDFIEKPIGSKGLLDSVARAIERSRESGKLLATRELAANTVASLTRRQRQVMDLVLAGHPSKNIAADLGISQRTVENHRALIMEKTGSKSLPALARLALAANT
jgi:two-component system CheB/CheR fusion protein